jgi:hypothetical protein
VALVAVVPSVPGASARAASDQEDSAASVRVGPVALVRTGPAALVRVGQVARAAVAVADAGDMGPVADAGVDPEVTCGPPFWRCWPRNRDTVTRS